MPSFPARALVCLLLAVSPAVAHAQSTEPPASGTSSEFATGVTAFDAGHYEDALVHFRSAHQVSSSPNAMLYIARSLEHLGRIAEAVSAYDITVRDAAARAPTEPRYAPTRDAAAAALGRLHDRVCAIRLRISSPPADLVVNVGGRVVDRAEWSMPVYVDPGTVQVNAQAAGFEPFATTLAMAGGASATVEMELRPASGSRASSQRAAASGGTRTANGSHAHDGVSAPGDESHPLRIAGIAGLVVGVAGFVVAGVFWSLANQQYNTLDQCAGGTASACPNSVPDALQTGRTYETVTNVGWVVGGVGAVVGAALLTVDIATPHRRITVGAAPGMLLVRGTF